MHVQFIEKSPHCDVIVDGYKVPHLKAHKVSEQEYNLVLNDQYALLVHTDDLDQMVWFIANAMASAAGYSAHGENSQVANPYRVQVLHIDNRSEG